MGGNGSNGGNGEGGRVLPKLRWSEGGADLNKE
jgi:hypothetical protein